MQLQKSSAQSQLNFKLLIERMNKSNETVYDSRAQICDHLNSVHFEIKKGTDQVLKELKSGRGYIVKAVARPEPSENLDDPNQLMLEKAELLHEYSRAYESIRKMIVVSFFNAMISSCPFYTRSKCSETLKKE
ncbi:unnamed protein product [Agarophyton chilense]